MAQVSSDNAFATPVSLRGCEPTMQQACERQRNRCRSTLHQRILIRTSCAQRVADRKRFIWLRFRMKATMSRVRTDSVQLMCGTMSSSSGDDDDIIGCIRTLKGIPRESFDLGNQAYGSVGKRASASSSRYESLREQWSEQRGRKSGDISNKKEGANHGDERTWQGHGIATTVEDPATKLTDETMRGIDKDVDRRK